MAFKAIISMKKRYFALILILVGFLGFLIPCLTFASTSFSDTSPIPALTSTTVTSTVGDYCSFFNSSGARLGGANGCLSGLSLTSTIAGTVYVTECATGGSYGCVSSGVDLVTAVSDPSFLTLNSFTFSAPIGGSSFCSSDECDTINILITSFLPQILLMIFFPILLVALAVKFMRNPTQM